jgi:ABC-type sugar transport system ATPase subunit
VIAPPAVETVQVSATGPTTGGGAAALVEFAGIGKRFGRLSVLDGLDLAVPTGDFLVVYGPPASGKTTLMRILMGLEQPSEGRVRLRGQDVTNLPAAERTIGYVPQSFALYPHLSVHDNIAYPLKLAGVRGSESEPVVRRVAEMLAISDLLRKKPDQLSGGQKQRVAIARGIAKQSDLYVLDDPLAGLDFKLREQLVDDLKTLQQQTRLTFLYTTSDPLEAMILADHVGVLDGGRIVEAGEPERLYAEPGNARTMALLGFPRANFLPGQLETGPSGLACRTPLFTFPVLPESGGVQPGGVSVGVRPESLRLAPTATADGHLHTEGTILLREDLGGEEIIYLDCDGVALTTIVRHAEQEEGIPAMGERTALAVRPSDLVVFSPGNGRRLGRGLIVRS